MDKMIVLRAGKDKLIIQQSGEDWWCPVYVSVDREAQLLGYGGWKDIIGKLLLGLQDSYNNKNIGDYLMSQDRMALCTLMIREAMTNWILLGQTRRTCFTV